MKNSKYSVEAGCSCLDSAYERKAIDEGMNHSPVFPENKLYLEEKKRYWNKKIQEEFNAQNYLE